MIVITHWMAGLILCSSLTAALITYTHQQTTIEMETTTTTTQQQQPTTREEEKKNRLQLIQACNQNLNSIGARQFRMRI